MFLVRQKTDTWLSNMLINMIEDNFTKFNFCRKYGNEIQISMQHEIIAKLKLTEAHLKNYYFYFVQTLKT